MTISSNTSATYFSSSRHGGQLSLEVGTGGQEGQLTELRREQYGIYGLRKSASDRVFEYESLNGALMVAKVGSLLSIKILKSEALRRNRR